jgi:hypothetical protein
VQETANFRDACNVATFVQWAQYERLKNASKQLSVGSHLLVHKKLDEKLLATVPITLMIMMQCNYSAAADALFL